MNLFCYFVIKSIQLNTYRLFIIIFFHSHVILLQTFQDSFLYKNTKSKLCCLVFNSISDFVTKLYLWSITMLFFHFPLINFKFETVMLQIFLQNWPIKCPVTLMTCVYHVHTFVKKVLIGRMLDNVLYYSQTMLESSSWIFLLAHLSKNGETL